LKILSHLNLKKYLLDKIGFQNRIKIEVILVEPPPLKAFPYAVIFTGAAYPNEGETGQLKRCTRIRKAYFACYQIASPGLIQRFDLI